MKSLNLAHYRAMRSLCCLLLLPLLISCTMPASSSWGALKVVLVNPQAHEKQWSANLQVQNLTKQVQQMQYVGTHQYTLQVEQNGKEIYKQSFQPLIDRPIMDLFPNAAKSHVVGWNYRDQNGQKVPSGTYYATVELHAVTGKIRSVKRVGPVKVEVK